MVVEICKYMSWDYETYIRQPLWMITHVTSRMIGENNAKKFLNLKYARK